MHTETDVEVSALTADTITDQIRDLILSGSYPVGLQLKQEALAKQFNVSRFPIRQAFKRLEAEGLIEHTPFAGSVVASRSVSELIETLDIRIGLETRALALAIPNMQKSDFEDLKQIMSDYDNSDSPREWSEHNLKFHLRLYKSCNRPRLLKMIEEMVRGVALHLRAQQSFRAGRKLPQAEHQALIEACIAKDTREAISILQTHIERTQQKLRNYEA